MNEYDSDKMADVLGAAQGYEPTSGRRAGRPDPLQHLLGAREGAGKGVQRPRPRQAPEEKGRADRRRRLRGQPGRRGHHRARALRGPGVRPADAAPLPQMIAAREPRRRRRWTSASPRSRSSTTCRRRAWTAPAPSCLIMEGCSKYCSYCVVPYTRGEEVSRPFDDVLVEVAGLADQGVKEVTLLGQNVNAYRGPMGDTATRDRRLRPAARVRGRDPRHRAHPLHHQPPQRVHAAPDRGLRQDPAAGEPPAPAGAARQRPHPDGHEARLHGHGIQEHDPQAARRAARHQPVERLHRRLPRRDRRRLRAR
jgi:hypothetical protein